MIFCALGHKKGVARCIFISIWALSRHVEPVCRLFISVDVYGKHLIYSRYARDWGTLFLDFSRAEIIPSIFLTYRGIGGHRGCQREEKEHKSYLKSEGKSFGELVSREEGT